MSATDEKTAAIKTDLAVIEKRYDFKEDFDLYQELLSLPRYLDALEIATIKYPRSSKKHKEVAGISGQCSRMLETLRNTAAQTKIHLSDPSDAPSEMEDQNMKSKIGKVDFNQLEKILKTVIANAHFLSANTPPDRGGRKSFAKSKMVIDWLASYFHNGTGAIPTCIYSCADDRYNGKFYYFILDIKDCLNDLGIDLPNDKTIGEYAEKQVSRYRKSIGKK